MLFSICIDKLFQLYTIQKIGYFVGHLFTGDFGYDILLLAPTRTSLDKMLQIADEFAAHRDMKNIPTKWKYMLLYCGQEESASIAFNKTTINNS